jgi:hypothetical protein
MGTAMGVNGQFGWVVEATPGTEITTMNKFLEVEDIDFVPAKAITQGKGIRGGATAPLAGRRYAAGIQFTGKGKHILATLGEGQFVRWLMGSSIAAPTLIAGSAYKQAHRPGDLSAAGSSLTMQYTDGSDCFTYAGSKCAGWTLSCDATGDLTLDFDVDATLEDIVTAKTAVTYTLGDLFRGNQMSIKYGGTVSGGSGELTTAGGTTLDGVRTVNLACPNPLALDRFYANNAGVRAPALLNDLRDITLSVTRDKLDNAQYAAFLADTGVPIVVAWTGALISGTSYYMHELTLPAVKWDAAPHPLAGPGIQQQALVGKVLDDGTNGYLQWKIVSSEVAL